MLIVLMVLMMTTATATFAIHSTTMEMRSAGYGRVSMQTGYVSEGAVYAGISYVDAIGPQATFIQYSRTTVTPDTPYVPGALSFDRPTNLLRIRQADFSSAAGTYGPPLETTTSPSLGTRNIYTADFLADGTDVHAYRPREAGREQSGNDPMGYIRINMTSRATMGVAGDSAISGDDLDRHDTIAHARAMAVVGPFGGVF